MSEFLRVEQGEKEIAEEENRNQQHNRRNQTHCRSPQLLAGFDVEKRQSEEKRREE
jgi:hypothetical protein